MWRNEALRRLCIPIEWFTLKDIVHLGLVLALNMHFGFGKHGTSRDSENLRKSMESTNYGR